MVCNRRISFYSLDSGLSQGLSQGQGQGQGQGQSGHGHGSQCLEGSPPPGHADGFDGSDGRCAARSCSMCPGSYHAECHDHSGATIPSKRKAAAALEGGRGFGGAVAVPVAVAADWTCVRCLEFEDANSRLTCSHASSARKEGSVLYSK